MDREPDYQRYTLPELLDVGRHIDRHAHPERYARLQDEIRRRESQEDLLPPPPARPQRVNGLPLPILSVLNVALRETGSRWRTLLRVLMAPALLTSSVQFLIAELALDSSWRSPLVLLTSVIYVLFAVTCHRVVLLGVDSIPTRWGLYWSHRETRYLGWTIAIGLIVVVVSLPLFYIAYKFMSIELLTEVTNVSSTVWNLVMFVFMFPSTYLLSRWSLVLPSTAIDRRPSLDSAWDLSHGNGWRLAILLGAPPLLLGTVFGELTMVIGMLDSAPMTFAINLVICLVGALEVTILSITYKWLRTEGMAGPSVAPS
jgi:hypothetical protein